MKIEKDGSGNSYIKVGNVRLTHVPAARRDPHKNWAEGRDIIRINAYKGPGNALFQGAEFPVGSPAEALEFVEAFCLLARTKGDV